MIHTHTRNSLPCNTSFRKNLYKFYHLFMNTVWKSSFKVLTILLSWLKNKIRLYCAERWKKKDNYEYWYGNGLFRVSVPDISSSHEEKATKRHNGKARFTARHYHSSRAKFPVTCVAKVTLEPTAVSTPMYHQITITQSINITSCRQESSHYHVHHMSNQDVDLLCHWSAQFALSEWNNAQSVAPIGQLQSQQYDI
jgi:hypothetical protein